MVGCNDENGGKKVGGREGRGKGRGGRGRRGGGEGGGEGENNRKGIITFLFATSLIVIESQFLGMRGSNPLSFANLQKNSLLLLADVQNLPNKII
jgi:hypothetical protein